MPYIRPENREQWNDTLAVIEHKVRRGNGVLPGDLNYLITSICDLYVNDNVNYATLNEVMGVLTCVQQEFYRRLAVPYEDKKIKENGDVFNER